MSIISSLNVRRTIEPTMTAEQWQLYTRVYGDACQDAAIAINEALKSAYNAGLPRRDVYRAVTETMLKYEHVGAYDSEPFAVLERILSHLFPNE